MSKQQMRKSRMKQIYLHINSTFSQQAHLVRQEDFPQMKSKSSMDKSTMVASSYSLKRPVLWRWRQSFDSSLAPCLTPHHPAFSNFENRITLILGTVWNV